MKPVNGTWGKKGNMFNTQCQKLWSNVDFVHVCSSLTVITTVGSWVERKKVNVYVMSLFSWFSYYIDALLYRL